MRIQSARTLLAFAIALLVVATVAQPVFATATPEASPIVSTAGINLSDMDLSVDPAEDFYRFANGGWVDRAEISAD